MFGQTPIDDNAATLAVMPLRSLLDDARSADPVFRTAIIRAVGNEWAARARSQWIVLAVLVVGLLAYVGLTRSYSNTAASLYLGLGFFVYAGILTFILVQYSKRASKAVWRRVVQPLVANGICGSCGYDIAGIPHDTMLLVRCPECGAAWHREYMVARDEHPYEPGRRVGSLGVRQSEIFGRRAWVTKDDRRLYVPVVTRSLYDLALSTTKDDVHRKQLASVSTHVSKMHRNQLLLIFPFVIGGQVVAGSFTGGSLLHLVLLIPVIGIVAGSIGMILDIKPKQHRVACVQAKICPSCVSLLHNAARAGDGCIVCSTCWAAWRA
ncbi:MAG: hypothetical protein H6815_02370 [Phycisphaeraceae bacterium]|nr:hypothetical protein [Phycisphaerales bacterium]MCB9859272.1 hypothetical protein [Phycisphaeraceae bacterium]